MMMSRDKIQLFLMGKRRLSLGKSSDSFKGKDSFFDEELIWQRLIRNGERNDGEWWSMLLGPTSSQERKSWYYFEISECTNLCQNNRKGPIVLTDTNQCQIWINTEWFYLQATKLKRSLTYIHASFKDVPEGNICEHLIDLLSTIGCVLVVPPNGILQISSMVRVVNYFCIEFRSF